MEITKPAVSGKQDFEYLKNFTNLTFWHFCFISSEMQHKKMAVGQWTLLVSGKLLFGSFMDLIQLVDTKKF